MVKNDKMAKTEKNFPQRRDGLLILVTRGIVSAEGGGVREISEM